MARPRVTWNGFVYYGEALGFALAWVVVIAVATQFAATPTSGPAPEEIAAADSVLGVLPAGIER